MGMRQLRSIMAEVQCVWQLEFSTTQRYSTKVSELKRRSCQDDVASTQRNFADQSFRLTYIGNRFFPDGLS
ncbi:hypothetical protein EG68_05003 [Paragonimus skrjabini miyazakii]|uniref:Uncharacterized protein n=1 Tax=Paragonimus skrjabini miyazakii TaxID=59628 RepID=A0A8S9YXJ3_9TREM|nr:hypothetical protein EG68_05003 [Paragonimus skrjabini miyazakii]